MFEVGILNSSGINVLLVGNGENIEYLLSSKFLRKLYTASERQIEGVINITFNTFRELAKKCKVLQIDLVIVENEKWINEGIVDILRSNFVNCIGVTAKWTQLGLSNQFAREMLKKYGIDTPPITLVPTGFPLIVKADGIIKRADNVQDVIKIRQEIFEYSPEIAKTILLEKYLDGEKILVTLLYDGLNLLTFPSEKIDENLLQDFSEKLKIMLQKEKADFIGFIHTEIIPHEGKLYVTDFRFEFRQVTCKTDILYLLWSAIYQKLNEIEL